MYNFENVKTIAVPKGENRIPAQSWLAENGLEVPDLAERCLHIDSI